MDLRPAVELAPQEPGASQAGSPSSWCAGLGWPVRGLVPSPKPRRRLPPSAPHRQPGRLRRDRTPTVARCPLHWLRPRALFLRESPGSAPRRPGRPSDRRQTAGEPRLQPRKASAVTLSWGLVVGSRVSVGASKRNWRKRGVLGKRDAPALVARAAVTSVHLHIVRRSGTRHLATGDECRFALGQRIR